MYLRDELEMLARAVAKASEAYEAEISRDGTDPAYFPIDFKVRMLDSTFETTLAEMTFKDVG